MLEGEKQTKHLTGTARNGCPQASAKPNDGQPIPFLSQRYPPTDFRFGMELDNSVTGRDFLATV